MSILKSRRELRKIVQAVHSEFEERITTRGHVMFGLKRAGRIQWITVSGTPSDPRSMLNMKSDLQRAVKKLTSEEPRA